MLKKSVSKAAADGRTGGGIASGYVEDAYEVRTPLAGIFSVLQEARSPFVYSMRMKAALLYRSGTPKQSECQGGSLEEHIVRGPKIDMQEREDGAAR